MCMRVHACVRVCVCVHTTTEGVCVCANVYVRTHACACVCVPVHTTAEELGS